MKAVVDDKIPYIHESIERLMDEVVYKPGKDICAEDLADANVLVVRTRTNCNKSLLHGSGVKFIATATIGFDHIDTHYLAEAGIQWTNCPGCNASSVGQYVHSNLLLLQRELGIDLKHSTVGIVGYGHVGREVYKHIAPLGCRILVNDPPLEAAGLAPRDITLHSLEQLQRECDIITFHTPLVTDGEWPTMHLADETFLSGLQRHPIIINSGRGEVVDNIALERAMDSGIVRQAIIDTWEGEPRLRLSLLDKVFIGTPHIAGYSADGKANATRMVLEAISRWMGQERQFDIQPPKLDGTPAPNASTDDIALWLYDPRQDSNRLKSHPEDFERQRGDYPLRRELL